MDDNFQVLYTIRPNDEILPWTVDRKRNVRGNSIVTGIKIKNRHFLISTYHSVSSAIENIFVNGDTAYKLSNNKYDIPEIDLTIFEEPNKVKEFTDFYEIGDLNDLDIDIASINDDVFDFIIPFNDNFKSLQCKLKKFTKCNYNNNCFPEMPCFIGELTEMSLEKINFNIDDLKGASGTPIFKDDKIYGFLSGCSSKSKLYIIPIFMIKRVISEILKTNNFFGLCKTFFDTNYINGATYISNLYNIDYNRYSQKNIKNSRIKRNDIILQLDNISVTNGMIYDKNLNSIIDIDSYVIINKDITCQNMFLISRPNNKIPIVEITIGNIDIHSCVNTNFKSDSIRFFIKDKKYVYAEICPKLFDLLRKYRTISSDDNIYSLFTIKYGEELKRGAILCDTLDNSYTIFSNQKVVAQTIDLKNLITPNKLFDIDNQLKLIKF